MNTFVNLKRALETATDEELDQVLSTVNKIMETFRKPAYQITEKVELDEEVASEEEGEFELPGDGSWQTFLSPWNN